MFRPAVIILIFGVSLAAASPPPASPPAKAVKGTFPVTREQALALIDYPYQQLPYEIVFLSQRRGFRGMTIGRQHRIEIYARPQDTADQIAYDVAHELGHAIDLTYNNVETRTKWMELRGIDPSTPWFGCDACSDYGTPAGDFAEVFALFLRGPEFFRGRIAAPPTPQQLELLAPFFHR